MKLKITGYSMLFLLLFIFAGCGASGEKTIAFMTVQKKTFELIIPAFGELQAVTSTPITVPPAVRGSQTIAWIAPENSIVKKGETVIRMDAAWYKEKIQSEEFSIAKLNLQIEEKEKELGKEKKELQGQLIITEIEKELAALYAAKDETIFSRNEIIEDAINLEYLKTKTRHFEQKKEQLEQKTSAELQLLQLKRKTHQVKVKQYRDALDSLEVKAPHDGLFIYEKNWRGEKPRVGMTVWRGMKLAKLPDLNRMEAKVYVLESEAAGLKADLPVSISLDSSPGKVFSGKVTNIDTIAKPLERESPLKYFEIKVGIDKTKKEIMKPGSQVKASVFVQKQDKVITLPNQALFFDDGHAFVNIKGSSNVERREVKIGARSLTLTVITEGLAEGEQVVLGNPMREGE